MAIANSQDSTLVKQLTTFLKDPSPSVRNGAVFALGCLPCRESVWLLTDHYKEETDPETKHQAAIAIGSIGKPGNIELHRSGIPKKVLYQAAVHTFDRNIFPDWLIMDCCQAMQSNNKSERTMASIALRRIRKPDVVRPYLNLLLSALNSNDGLVRSAVVKLLSRMDFRQKAASLRVMSSDPDWRVRYEIASAIPYLGGYSDSVWVSLINDPSPYVVNTALQSTPIKILRTPEKMDIILKYLSSESKTIRRSAARCIFSSSDPTLDSIRQELQKDSDLIIGILADLDNDKPSRSGFDLALPYSHSRDKSIASPAYSYLISCLDTLIQYNHISEAERMSVIVGGLINNDPVQMWLAANYIKSTSVKIDGIEPYLYNCLKKHSNFQFSNPLIMVITAIDSLRPPDAVKNLRQYLNSPNPVVRQEIYRILCISYGLQLPKQDFTGDPYLYNSLSKIKKYGLNPCVEVKTERGIIVIQCLAYYAPYTVNAFLECVDSGYYTGLLFHRVVPNFVVQAGDPRGDGWGGPDYHLLTERSPLCFETGSVGMANAGPNTEGSQFFITTSPQYHLNYKYTLFGNVESGMDVVEKIEVGDRIVSARIIQ